MNTNCVRFLFLSAYNEYQRMIIIFKNLSNQCILFIFSIGLDGKITLEKRLKGIYVQAEKLHEAQQNLVQAGKEVPIK